MRIITYTASDFDAAPAGAEAIARIRCHMPAMGKRKAGEDWHPVIFTAPTAEEARTLAADWWEAELAKAAARVAQGERLAQARKDRKAA